MYRYSVDDKIGEGCFGTVMRGRFLETGCPVALKKVPIRRLQEGIPNAVARELVAMQQLVNSPNCVRLYEAFPSGSSLVLVTELCATDLGSVLRGFSAFAPVPIEYAKTWMQMILTGIASIHEKGILHRDIKPANLLLTNKNVIKVADFGLARVYDPQQKQDMTHEVATRWYRAPELLFGETRYGPSMDIWGIGCVFAELLCGSSGAVMFPGEGDIDQITKIFKVLGTPTEQTWPGVDRLPDWNKIVFSPSSGTGLRERLPLRVPESAVDLLSKLLALNPRDRWSAADALRHPFFTEDPQPAASTTIVLPKAPAKLPTLEQVLSGKAVRCAAAPWDPAASPASLTPSLAPYCDLPLPFRAPPKEEPVADDRQSASGHSGAGGQHRHGGRTTGPQGVYLDRSTLHARRLSAAHTGTDSDEENTDSTSDSSDGSVSSSGQKSPSVHNGYQQSDRSDKR